MNETKPDLQGLRILVVEDEYFIAEEMAEVLSGAGADVVGPLATVAGALRAVREERLNAAILDVNLGGQMVWPVVEALGNRGLPVVLSTGYDAGALPPPYLGLPRCEKPINPRLVVELLAQALSGRA